MFHILDFILLTNFFLSLNFHILYRNGCGIADLIQKIWDSILLTLGATWDLNSRWPRSRLAAATAPWDIDSIYGAASRGPGLLTNMTTHFENTQWRKVF